MDIFRIVSFIHDIEIRFSGSVTLPEELFRVRDIVDRMLGDLQSSDNLLSCFYWNRGFQKSLSRLSSPLRIIATCIWTGKIRWINGGRGDPFAPIIEHLLKPVEQSVEDKWLDSVTEFLFRCKMRHVLELNLLPDGTHNFSEPDGIPVFFSQILFQE